MKTHRGFTLIELLVVISIIGVLSSVVLANMRSARERARDGQRKTELKRLELALELYYDVHRNYPSTGGAWFSSDPDDVVTDNEGVYIPGLSPVFIGSLPRDPGRSAPEFVGCASQGWKSAFLYRSDGATYKLLSHCAPENPWTSADLFYDPVRPTWAWMVCSGSACNTW